MREGRFAALRDRTLDMLDALRTRDALPEAATTCTSASLASSVTRNMALGSDSVTTLHVHVHVQVCACAHARRMDRASQPFCSTRRVYNMPALVGVHRRAEAGIMRDSLASDPIR